jgi:hypothetical protein
MTMKGVAILIILARTDLGIGPGSSEQSIETWPKKQIRRQKALSYRMK